MRTLLVTLPLLAMTIPAHAAWLHQCPAATDGAPPRYVVDDREHAPGCTSVALVAGADVDAVYPLAHGEMPEDVIVLNGNVTDGRFAVSEHELPSTARGPARPQPMPLHENLLRSMDVRTFGAEERVQAHLENGHLRVTCRAGQRAAGAILTGPWFMTRANTALAAGYEARGGAFTWQVADAARQQRGDALDMGVLAAGAKSARLTPPAALDRAGWRQFVLLCPASEASIDVTALAQEPAAAPKAAPRATWVWRPGDWIDGGPALLDWAAGQGIRELFVTVPLTGGAVRDPGHLAAFVRAAGARGIVIYSVDGDPHMVLPGEVPAAVRRVRAYAAYNAAQPADARLRGAQFDVEPYLLPETVLAPSRRDAAYIGMARALKAAAGEGLRLEFVVPFWWGRNPALLDALAPTADALAVMDYRTDRAQIVFFAIPFLDWASAHGRQVRVALEAGAIEPEVQRRYVKATSGPGDLQAVDVDGRQVLVLLRKPVASTDARMYRLAGTRTIDGSATTFHKDKPALLRQLPGLEQEFGLWDGFGGIAIHELR
ncbi:hypothetical protein HAV22_10180 [Massilia sp. TW-1]|uniref:Glycoside hydrolase family 42 N-terminal domain-containing protein n=1 Tax=Telluria antibiotica TaxID=2717319 RepID=A0ABX0PAS5_9BURK|nr:hypothetical protein [Telluria antibiotica]NIA54011.1 hypothetical protein [Telluria antibiotica]